MKLNRRSGIPFPTCINAAVMLCIVLFAGCSVAKPDPLPRMRPMPSLMANATDTQQISNLTWRKFFTDQHLLALIDTAFTSNPDLLMAAQRVAIAKSQLKMKKGLLFPSVQGVASVGFDRFGDYTMNGVGNFDTNLSPNIKEDQKIPTSMTPDFFLGFRSNWEIDLWGKLRNQKKAAASQMMATQYAQQLLSTQIVAEIASLYYELLALDTEMHIVEKNIQLQEQAVEIVKVQKEGGRATELAVQQFNAQLMNTKAIAYNLRQQLVETENQMNVILGRYPAHVNRDTSIMQQQVPLDANGRIASSLLIRRPDLQQAEQELHAAKFNVASARAAFLPSLQLTPYIGMNAFKSALLFNPASLAYGVASGLTAPLFNQRQISGEFEIANAQAKTAVYNYQQKLLYAYSEVITSLRSIENNQRQFELKKKEVEELTAAVLTARELYLAGYANYLEIITAQKGVLEAELELTNRKKELFLGVIKLYRSLGGGWE